MAATFNFCLNVTVEQERAYLDTRGAPLAAEEERAPHLIRSDRERAERLICHTKRVNEALMTLWNAVAPHVPDHRAPRSTTAKAIRQWMADPNHAPLLRGVIDIYFRSSLEAIPPTLNRLPFLHTLRIQRTSIAKIDARAFADCPALADLDLDHNEISEIGPEPFVGCARLLTLRLNNNKITHIPPGTFTGCPALEELYLNDNRIAYIDCYTFLGCRNLRRLWLNDNQITHIPNWTFSTFSTLLRLHLENNAIVQIGPKAFTERRELQEMRWEGGIPTVIQLMIPQQIVAGCLTLRAVDLSNNNLTQIDPLTFMDCADLRQLDLSNNQIAQLISHTFAGCPSLTTLLLHHNRITQITDHTLTGCSSLKVLHLNNNALFEIDAQAFTHCPVLMSLHLEDNPVAAEIDPQAVYAALPDLHTVRLE